MSIPQRIASDASRLVLRGAAEEIFRRSLADCSIEQSFARIVKSSIDGAGAGSLYVGDLATNLNSVGHIRIIAIGKASAPMLQAVLSHAQVALSGDLAGILIAPALPSGLPPLFQYFCGGHPLPNEASFAGAEAALSMLASLHAQHSGDAFVLFLISGGASAMMELPLDPAISLADTVAFHDALVHCGASIAEINCVRKHFSAVKGGRLAVAARGIPALSLLVSDVPPGHLDALASGPTLPDTSRVEQCREVIGRYNLLDRFPSSVGRFFSSPDLLETPKSKEPMSRAVTVLSADDLAKAAREHARAMGFHAVIDNTCDDWEYRAAAEYLVGRLRELRREHDHVCLISSGEVAVRLPSAHGNVGGEIRSGLGGRNQHFALYAATLLRPSDASTVVFSAGSDGIDGNSPAAGAVVDDQTLRSGGDVSEVQRVLDHFDSNTFFQGIGATIMTGPTGNNLRDLRILLATGPVSAK